MDQCWRDVLQVAWGHHSSEDKAFLDSLPPGKEIHICATCCQQFLLGRNMVLSRPLAVWKKLHQIIGVDEGCHNGLSDVIPNSKENKVGGLIQGGTMEHLAHVVYGHKPLIMSETTMDDVCEQYFEDDKCPGSPCSPSMTFKAKLESVKHSHVGK